MVTESDQEGSEIEFTTNQLFANYFVINLLINW